MRKPVPLRWIEEAEARAVIGMALHEAPPALPRVAGGARWTAWLRRWVGSGTAYSQAAIEKPEGAPPVKGL